MKPFMKHAFPVHKKEFSQMPHKVQNLDRAIDQSGL